MAFATLLIVCASNAVGADDSPAGFLESWAKAWRPSDVDKMMSFYDTAGDRVPDQIGGGRTKP
jgi:hypothetical protein